MIIGVAMRILPSLLKNIVIKKQSKFVYQKRASPEPFAFLAKLNAAQRKKPTLSITIDIMMVDRMVTAAPLTVAAI